jgi:hypothetical protein
MHGAGFGVPQTRTSTQLWAAATFGPAAKIPLGGPRAPIALWIEGDGVVALTRPTFHMRNLDTLYTPAPAGVEAWAGIEIRFGSL